MHRYTFAIQTANTCYHGNNSLYRHCLRNSFTTRQNPYVNNSQRHDIHRPDYNPHKEYCKRLYRNIHTFAAQQHTRLATGAQHHTQAATCRDPTNTILRVCLNLTRRYNSGFLSIPSKVFSGDFRQVSSVTMPASLPPQLTQISPKNPL